MITQKKIISQVIWHGNIKTRSTVQQKLSLFTPLTTINKLTDQVFGGKTVKNVKISPTTTDIWSK